MHHAYLPFIVLEKSLAAGVTNDSTAWTKGVHCRGRRQSDKLEPEGPGLTVRKPA